MKTTHRPDVDWTETFNASRFGVSEEVPTMFALYQLAWAYKGLRSIGGILRWGVSLLWVSVYLWFPFRMNGWRSVEIVHKPKGTQLPFVYQNGTGWVLGNLNDVVTQVNVYVFAAMVKRRIFEASEYSDVASSDGQTGCTDGGRVPGASDIPPLPVTVYEFPRSNYGGYCTVNSIHAISDSGVCVDLTPLYRTAYPPSAGAGDSLSICRKKTARFLCYMYAVRTSPLAFPFRPSELATPWSSCSAQNTVRWQVASTYSDVDEHFDINELYVLQPIH